MESRLEPVEEARIDLAETTEERLRKEIEDLKRQLREQKEPGLFARRAGREAVASVFDHALVDCLGVIVLYRGGFFAGYIPLQKRQALIRGSPRARAGPAADGSDRGGALLSQE